MAKLIVKAKYYHGHSHKVGGYLKYIATREGVEIIDEARKSLPATRKQKELITGILQDFPDAKEMLEYEDYSKAPTVGNASEFISRVLEDNAPDIIDMDGKTYADYIATRPGAEQFGRKHGLFGNAGETIDLEAVSEELNAYTGNVHTLIVSLRREDAARLGFDAGVRWRDMLRTQTETLAKNYKIPMEHLRWYAAYHNEGHHPHVHVMVWSNQPGQAYLTGKGLKKIKASLTHDIFQQDLACIYARQTEYRDALRQEARKESAALVRQMAAGSHPRPEVKQLLLRLARTLQQSGGKKVYKFLPPEQKQLVDAIVSELEKVPEIASLFDRWYEQREEVLRLYHSELPQRLSLADCPEFLPVKNAVIREATALETVSPMPEADAPLPPDGDAPGMEDTFNDLTDTDMESYLDSFTDADAPPPNWDASPDGLEVAADQDKPNVEGMLNARQWWSDTYREARNALYGTKAAPADPEKAFALMRAEAVAGNGLAMHDLGKMLLSGLGCEKNEVLAHSWFLQAHNAFLRMERTDKKPSYWQYRIGKLYSYGYGVEQDYSASAEWFTKAVEGNSPFAAYALGGQYCRGQGVEQDFTKAFELFTMAATAGKKPNAYAQYQLGRMCKAGVGTAVDRSASEDWYRQAYQGFLQIEQNMADDRLYYRLGSMNLTGTGTEVDLSKAEMYLEKAAKLDNPDALYGLGKLYLRKDFDGYAPAKATAYLEKAVSQKSTDAQCLLGKLLLQGEVVEQDTQRAVVLLKKAAEAESTYAAYLLGKAYLDGTALPQKIPEALRLLTESAEKGFTPAEYQLGAVYYRGEAVPQDVPKALSYLERAAEKENAYAAYLAGKILLTEESVKDVDKAIRLLEFAAGNGNDFAEYQLGKLYLYGRDVPQDYEEAIRYLTASAEHGNQYAEQLLSNLQTNRNHAAAIGACNLLQHISRILQNRLEDERKELGARTDRKLRQKINQKKLAAGLRLE